MATALLPKHLLSTVPRRQALPEAGPELVFGLLAAIDTDLDRVSAHLSACLDDVSYQARMIRLSELLREADLSTALIEEPLDKRYRSYMNAGTELRKTAQRGDALAVLAMMQMRKLRTETNRESAEDRPLLRTAYV